MSKSKYSCDDDDGDDGELNQAFGDDLQKATTKEEVVAVLKELNRFQMEELKYNTREGPLTVIEVCRDSGRWGEYDGCHAIVKHNPTGLTLRLDGYYSSYEGKIFDDMTSWYEVKAVEVTITKYERVTK